MGDAVIGTLHDEEAQMRRGFIELFP